MVVMTVLLMLEAAPGLWADGPPRHARLIAGEVAAKSYHSMSRAELLAERRALEASRPGVVLPVLTMTGGGIAAVCLAIGFWASFATPYGLAVYSAAIIITAFVVAIGIIVAGTFWLARNKPAHDDIGAELERIDEAERALGCGGEGQAPCPRVPTSPGFVPQVRLPGPQPTLVLASF